MRILAQLAGAVLLVTPVFAQLEGPSPLEVHLPVWTQGEPLTLDGMAASVNGGPAAITKLATPDDDLVLLVVLDLTDDLAAVEQARQALIDRINTFPANHIVGVLSSQNGLRVLTEPTDNREAIAAAIRSHPVGGRAGLLETIEQAAQIGTSMISASGVRLAVLYLTDSDIGNYRENFTNPTVNNSDSGDLSRRFPDVLVRERMQRALQALAATDVPIFISHLAYRSDQLNEAYQTGLISLAASTGGSANISRSISEIPTAIDSLVERIRGHYSLAVALPSDADTRKLSFLIDTDKGLHLDYRADYVLHP
jgi:hypothetical protein